MASCRAKSAATPAGTAAGVATRGVPFRALALRTLKSEVLVGVSEEAVGHARAARRDWMTDGFYGVIQTLGGG